MLNQQVLDNTINFHIINNGRPGVIIDINDLTFCRFRDGFGGKCGLGCSMTDEEYKPEMEGLGINELQEKYGLFPGCDRIFLRDLQNCHDGAVVDARTSFNTTFKVSYIERLKCWFDEKACEKYNVKLPDLQKFLDGD